VTHTENTTRCPDHYNNHNTPQIRSNAFHDMLVGPVDITNKFLNVSNLTPRLTV